MKREEFGYRERLRKGARKEGDVTVCPPSDGFGGGKLGDEKLKKHWEECDREGCPVCDSFEQRMTEGDAAHDHSGEFEEGW